MDSVLRSVRSFFAGTLLSRVAGMARDIAMAISFGCAPEVAAFMVAYRLANLFRRLLGEGNVQGGFVPQFERCRSQGEAVAAAFYRDAAYSMLMFLVVALGMVEVVGWMVFWFWPSDILLMTLFIAPGIAFLCLYALNSCVLQCYRRYFLPAFAPVAFNVVWITLACVLSGRMPREAMFCLSIGLSAAFMLQWQITSRPVAKWLHVTLGSEKRCPEFFSQEVRTLLKSLSLGIIGIGASQINNALDAIFARIADPSGPAYLWYAMRIQQLPLALFGVALTGALLPPLSRAARAGIPQEYGDLLRQGLKQGAVFIIPCAVGMLALAAPGIDLLYGHGEFHYEGVAAATLCLQNYAWGLVPMVGVLLLANGFYARRDYRWPMQCSAVSVVCNILLNVVFVFGFHWGAASIALATTLSAYLNCALLAGRLHREVGSMIPWRQMGRITLCSAVAMVVVYGVDYLVWPTRTLLAQTTRFVATSGIYIVCLFGCAYLLKVQEILELPFLVINRRRSVEEQ